MALRFTPEAFSDLDALEAYLADRSPDGLRNVLFALQKAFRHIETNPDTGKPTTISNVRIWIEPSYKYSILYILRGDVIWILRVYHPRRKPLDLDGLELP